MAGRGVCRGPAAGERSEHGARRQQIVRAMNAARDIEFRLVSAPGRRAGVLDGDGADPASTVVDVLSDRERARGGGVVLIDLRLFRGRARAVRQADCQCRQKEQTVVVCHWLLVVVASAIRSKRAVRTGRKPTRWLHKKRMIPAGFFVEKKDQEIARGLPR